QCPPAVGLATRVLAPGESLPVPRTGSGLKPQEPWQTGPLADIRQTGKSGDTLLITETGAVKLTENQSFMGQVLINGQPMQVKGHRYRQMPGNTNPYLHVQVEQRMESPKIRHHRELQISGAGSAGVCDAIDNLGLTPVTFELSIVAAMGGDLADIRDSMNRPLGKQGNSLSLPEPAVLGTALAAGGVTRLTSIGLATADPEQKPLLKWDAARKAVLCSWTVHLEAFERCHLRYNFASTRTTTDDELLRVLPKQAPVPWSTSSPTFHIRKLNVEEKGLRGEDGTRKDSLGYRWRMHARTMDGMWCETGAAQLLGLWIEGEPSSYGTVLDYVGGAAGTPGASQPDRLVECSAAVGGMRSARRLRFNPQTATVQTVDTLYTVHEKPLAGRAELTVIASDRITKVLDAKGKRLDLAKVIPASEHGNKFAVVFDDNKESAVLVALADPEGKLQPTLNFAAGRGLFIRYETTLNPGDKVPLIHAATQRRLVDYPAIEEAFTSWESPTLLTP
ncbi:MAG TPA: hypothetical protein VK956_00175, partial [Verrucomicrobium sp.]|nr:hypothetical protein [Verrucomicrobium sp.]